MIVHFVNSIYDAAPWQTQKIRKTVFFFHPSLLDFLFQSLLLWWAQHAVQTNTYWHVYLLLSQLMGNRFITELNTYRVDIVSVILAWSSSLPCKRTVKAQHSGGAEGDDNKPPTGNSFHRVHLFESEPGGLLPHLFLFISPAILG